MSEAGTAVEATARVVESLPNSMYRLELQTEGRPGLTAHVGSPALLRLLPGDLVVVEISSFDAQRGRIVRRA